MRDFLRTRMDRSGAAARRGRVRAAFVAAVLACTSACNGGDPSSTAAPSVPAEQPCRLDVVETVPVETPGDPEGIAGSAGRLFVSTLHGAVLAGESAEPRSSLEVLSPPTEARVAAGGLRVVGSSVVVAGLRARVVDVLDARTGELRSSRPTPDDALPNDVVVDDGTVYVSDTQEDRLFTAALGEDGRLGPIEPFADLAPALDRANGMTLTPDASALLVVGTARGLARVDLATAEVTAVTGGDDVSGDGLHLLGDRLYTSINRWITVLDVEPDGSAVRLRGRVEIEAPTGLATLTSDGADLLVLSSGLRYVRQSPDNAVLRVDPSGCT